MPRGRAMPPARVLALSLSFVVLLAAVLVLGVACSSRLSWQSAWQSTSHHQTGLWRSSWIRHLT